ncbi:MAG: hypothetical protein D8H92_05685 [Campylobacter sp.]|nr:MAG: hypothetical protein D8H92_05685 [Campylobacter sp.]
MYSALTFLFSKFAVASASTYAALNFDFNGCGRRLAPLKSKFCPAASAKFTISKFKILSVKF